MESDGRTDGRTNGIFYEAPHTKSPFGAMTRLHPQGKGGPEGTFCVGPRSFGKFHTPPKKRGFSGEVATDPWVIFGFGIQFLKTSVRKAPKGGPKTVQKLKNRILQNPQKSLKSTVLTSLKSLLALCFSKKDQKKVKMIIFC